MICLRVWMGTGRAEGVVDGGWEAGAVMACNSLGLGEIRVDIAGVSFPC